MLIIGICGRTGSGKTEFAKRIETELKLSSIDVGIISMDDFYEELSEPDHVRALDNRYDFDCIESFNIDALYDTIWEAKNGHDIAYNLYDHANHKHKPQPKKVEACDVWIVEGLYLFAADKLLPLFDLKIFMEVDADESLIRRIRRDIVSRRRTVEGVLLQYERYVKPAYNSIVAPSREKADICVLRGAFNTPAFEGVISFIKSKIKK